MDHGRVRRRPSSCAASRSSVRRRTARRRRRPVRPSSRRLPAATGRLHRCAGGRSATAPAAATRRGRRTSLRVLVGERSEPAWRRQRGLAVVEANIDDLAPQLVADAFEALLAAGALDVWTTPIQMKRGRLAVTLSALVDEGRRPAIEEAFFQTTTTLGVRAYGVERAVLERDTVEVQRARSRRPGEARLAGQRDGHGHTRASRRRGALGAPRSPGPPPLGRGVCRCARRARTTRPRSRLMSKPASDPELTVMTEAELASHARRGGRRGRPARRSLLVRHLPGLLPADPPAGPDEGRGGQATHPICAGDTGRRSPTKMPTSPTVPSPSTCWPTSSTSRKACSTATAGATSGGAGRRWSCAGCAIRPSSSNRATRCSCRRCAGSPTGSL